MLEDGYRDLRRLGLEAEITTTSSVSIIERKLPMDIRREWAQSVSSDASMVDKMNKFPSLLRFLLNQKRAIEYDCAALRAYNSNTAMSKAVTHHATAREYTDERQSNYSKCLFHNNAEHWTSECKLYLSESVDGRKRMLKEKDNAASISLITNKKAREEKLKGIRAELSIVKVGAKSEKIASEKYRLCLIDKKGQIVEFDIYGIDKITSDIQSINIDGIVQLFKNVSKEEIVRPTGAINVLIGCEYAGFHLEREQNSEHLLLLKNHFGRCIGGTHPLIKETSVKPNLSDVKVLHVMKANVEDFYNIENLGIECKPRCGGCKCGRCPIGSKEYSIKEERELELIDKNLEYDYQDGRWIAEYPWIKNPSALPDNRRVAVATLISTEKRLLKNPQHAKIYDMQIKDMVARDVARKLSKKELNSYKGPIHYISHHEVLKPDSKSTPVRIVFNSSTNYMGHVLNEYWAKGPDLLNNLVGVLIRFRENQVALMGDIRKMYHTVKTKPIDQHTHRFLWRDMDTTREPDTYIIQRVSFGDKPSGTIATVALRKTAEMGRERYPQATQIIQDNTYMDDIIDSTEDLPTAQTIASDIENLIKKGGFQVKGWIFSDDPINQDKTAIPSEPNTSTEKVLGIIWNPVKDYLCFEVKLNFSRKKHKLRIETDSKTNPLPYEIPEQLTKRIILSQVNSIYDPLGLSGPFTVRAKIMMRQIWASDIKKNWDCPIPEENKRDWIMFFKELHEMDNVKFKRCMKPRDTVRDPILIIFSDGSSQAFGACAFVRWELKGGLFKSSLLLSKNRLAPIKKMSIDRIELCGAIINKRLKVLVQQQCRYHFQKFYHIVDSQIVHAMIQKDSYGFNTFAATCIGEIQEGTDPKDWYWVKCEYNIADWLTRGKKPSELGFGSSWQDGPTFLNQPESEWAISRNYAEQQLPDMVKTVRIATAVIKDDIVTRININNYSNYKRLLRLTARVLSMSMKPTFFNVKREPTAEDLMKAEDLWIKEAQRNLQEELKAGKYKRLCPRLRKDGIYVVGGRATRWMEMSYNKSEVILLSYGHRFSRLYAEYVHNFTLRSITNCQ
ncbi:uncharacterized protein [Montipora foliosa]|uniref:uncharacterized protein n=1 Tax=Montipora foliosa TaxID=591990 RepID=UPI0035F1F00D